MPPLGGGEGLVALSMLILCSPSQFKMGPRRSTTSTRRHHEHTVGPGQCCSVVVQAIEAPVGTVWAVVRRFDWPQAYKHFIRSCFLVDNDDGMVGSVREVYNKRPATTPSPKDRPSNPATASSLCKAPLSTIGWEEDAGKLGSRRGAAGACVRIMPYTASRPSAPQRARVAAVGAGWKAAAHAASCGAVPGEVARHHEHAAGAGQCCSAVVQAIEAPVGAVWAVVRRFDRPQAYKHFIRSCRVVDGDGGAVGSETYLYSEFSRKQISKTICATGTRRSRCTECLTKNYHFRGLRPTELPL
uniref:Abscisic acid receptor PYL4 n=1 Tax=Aegilops tauschii TaxID=37682 RepID=R7W6U9_AEGTA